MTDKNTNAIQNESVVQTLNKQKVTNILYKTLVYGFLAIMALMMIIPFYWMFNTALKSNIELDAVVPSLLPKSFSISNFVNAFAEGGRSSSGSNLNMGNYLLNTVIVALFSTVLGTLFSIFMAFALARLQFKGREAVFTLLLATMMIPGEMMVVTNFKTIAALDWFKNENSFYAMIFPFLISVFHVYLLRQTFKQIPNELYYAAKVDGTSDWKYLWKVMVPMAKSSIITIVILKVMGTWNAYVWPNLVAAEEYKLITSWLRSGFTDSEGVTQLNLQMAATIMVTVPLLIIFLVFRKYIMSGVSKSGIKG